MKVLVDYFIYLFSRLLSVDFVIYPSIALVSLTILLLIQRIISGRG